MSRPTTTSSEFYAVIKHVYIPFACLDTKGRRVKRLSRSRHQPQPSKGLTFYFLAWGHFWFITFSLFSILGSSNVLDWEGDHSDGVCEKAEDLVCPPETALKDLLQRSIRGFGQESNRPWPLSRLWMEKLNVGAAETLRIRIYEKIRNDLSALCCWVNLA